MVVLGLLAAVASHWGAQALEGTGFSGCGSWALSRAQAQVVVVQELSCSVACGIFLDQESNPRLLHWQVDSLLLSHWGSPEILFLQVKFVMTLRENKAYQQFLESWEGQYYGKNWLLRL